MQEQEPIFLSSYSASNSEQYKSNSQMSDENNHAEDRNDPQSAQPFSCVKCQKSYIIKKSFVNHLRSHDLSYECEYDKCGKKFNIESSLERHVRVHTGQQPFQCDYSECDRKFSQRSNLNRHKKIHRSDKRFICGTCLRKFTTTTNLKQHEQIHAQNKEERKVFNCEVQGCEKKYLYNCNLKKHVKDHTDPMGEVIAETNPQAHAFSLTVGFCKIKIVLSNPSEKDHAQCVITHRQLSGATVYDPDDFSIQNLEVKMQELLNRAKGSVSASIEIHQSLRMAVNQIVDIVINCCGLTGCKSITVKLHSYDLFAETIGFVLRNYRPDFMGSQQN